MLNDIIKHLKEVCREQKLDVTENCLFEQAIKIMISNNIDKSHKEMYQSKKIVDSGALSKVQDNDKPTSKQVLALKVLKYSKEDIDKLNKKSAWKIINDSKKEY